MFAAFHLSLVAGGIARTPRRSGEEDRHAQQESVGDAKTSAFTLIELLAVMAIVATLASIVIGVGRYTNNTAKVARAKAELAGIAAAVEKYRAKYGDYPQTFESPVMLQSLIGKRGPNGAAIADIALIEVDRFTTQEETNPAGRSDVSLCDPWGSPYQYRYKSAVAGSSFGFVLYSSGPDQAATADARGRFDPLLPENADNIFANQ